MPPPWREPGRRLTLRKGTSPMMTNQSGYSDDRVDRVLDKLRESGALVKSAGRDQWVAQCPAHPDRNPSLSVRSTDGRVLVHCFAGCETQDVLDALDLEFGDLFAGSTRNSGKGWRW